MEGNVRDLLRAASLEGPGVLSSVIIWSVIHPRRLKLSTIEMAAEVTAGRGGRGRETEVDAC